jgi:uncharacterized protein YndB with AHSA1/START domain
MKWLLIAGAVVAALVIVVAIVGTLLPRDHVAIVRARIAGTPDTVWHAIADVANHPTWRTGVKRVELREPIDGKTAWREHSSHGSLLMVADHSEPPRRFVTRIADDKLPFGGTWEFVVEPTDGDGSTVTVTERGSVYNPVFRFMSRVLFGHTATIETYLRSLGRKFGSEPTPTVVANATSR